jgi:hypothetical protein
MRRRHRLKYGHGMTIEQFDKMLAAQGGVCAICAGEPSMANSRDRCLHVDHDHATGKIRGLLCNRCNRALGLFRDNAAVLSVAAEYLRAR